MRTILITCLLLTGCGDYWVIEEQLKEIAKQQKRATDMTIKHIRKRCGY